MGSDAGRRCAATATGEAMAEVAENKVADHDADPAAENGAEVEGDCESETSIRNGDGEDGDEGDEEDDTDKDDDDDVDWEEVHACPLTIRFTQEKVHPFFYRRGPIVKVVPKIRLAISPPGIGETSTWIQGDPGCDCETYELKPPFQTIRCLRKGNELWSLDNRRLYALQLAAMEQWPVRCRVRVLYTNSLPRRQLKTHWRKLQTTTEGRSIIIRARYQQFDVWSWFDRAVELEMSAFSYRLGYALNLFQVLPVVGVLLFRAGLTLFSSRLPYVVGFVVAFGIDLLRLRVTSFERRVSELHVKAMMDGDVWVLWPGGATAEPGESAMSMPQLAAWMVVVLVLMLPYVQSATHDKLRSSLFSCWLGVFCVVAIQCFSILRARRAAAVEYLGIDNRYSPKHR
mmetsp:Transcript_66826/g.186563  ORF Transcript_66826/g.186563 Transcript_66826/m.186563 type:complete len:400 (-) Transcript_66826:246-1445(-)